MKSLALSLVLAPVLGLLVGCASSNDGNTAEESDDLTTLPSTSTTNAPVIHPSGIAIWGCNFDDGRSLVFVQGAPHRPRGAIRFFGDHQDALGSRDTLAGGGGQTPTSTTEVRFKQTGQVVDFTAGGATVLRVDMAARFHAEGFDYPWTGSASGATFGCWGPTE